MIYIHTHWLVDVENLNEISYLTPSSDIYLLYNQQVNLSMQQLLTLHKENARNRQKSTFLINFVSNLIEIQTYEFEYIRVRKI